LDCRRVSASGYNAKSTSQKVQIMVAGGGQCRRGRWQLSAAAAAAACAHDAQTLVGAVQSSSALLSSGRRSHAVLAVGRVDGVQAVDTARVELLSQRPARNSEFHTPLQRCHSDMERGRSAISTTFRQRRSERGRPSLSSLAVAQPTPRRPSQDIFGRPRSNFAPSFTYLH